MVYNIDIEFLISHQVPWIRSERDLMDQSSDLITLSLDSLGLEITGPRDTILRVRLTKFNLQPRFSNYNHLNFAFKTIFVFFN